jgi:hypothetical protein
MEKIEGNTKGNIKVGHLGGDRNTELNQMLLAKYKEQTGLTNIYSNTPLSNFINVYAKNNNININVHTPAELVRDWKTMPNGNNFYFDSCGVAVYPNKGLNEQHRKRVLNILKLNKSKFDKKDMPILVEGLDVIKDTDGFAFETSNYVKFTEAPFLQKNGFVKYDEVEEKLVSADKGTRIWTPCGKLGIHGVYRGRSGVLNAGGVNLSNGNSSGRVPVWQDTECLDEKIAGLSPEHLEKIEKQWEEYYKTLIGK